MTCATCGLNECGHLRNDPKAPSAGALAQIRQQLLGQSQPIVPPTSQVPTNDLPVPKGESR
jgi:hypothetical protein